MSGYTGVTAKNDQQQEGFEWRTRISTPHRFRLGPGTFGNWYEVGIGQWVQLCNINRSQNAQIAGVPYTRTTAYTNGEYWLDNIYPYAPPFPANSDGSPDFEKEDSPSSGFIAGSIRISIFDQFQLYVMYLPPDAGQGVQWVSLHKTYWQWAVDAHLSTGSSGQWVPNPPGQVTVIGGVRWWLHPIWNTIFGNIGG